MKATYLSCLLSASIFGGLLGNSEITSYAQYAWFEQNTDTIFVDGNSEMDDAATYEAMIMFPSSHQSGGYLFIEYTCGLEQKDFWLSYKAIQGQTLPGGTIATEDPSGLLSLDEWHHVALVATDSRLSIYVDGIRVQSGPKSVTGIANGDGKTFIGAMMGCSQFYSGFVGYLDSIRISKVARYTGLSFVPPKGDLPSDADTVLLYNFNDPESSNTIKDESPLARTGHLGTGFNGATSPKIISKLPTEMDLGLKIFTAVELRFSSSVDAQYYIQSSSDMAVWTDMPGVIIGDGTVMKKLISTEGSAKVFYRVVARP